MRGRKSRPAFVFALLASAALASSASAADYYLISGNANQITVIDADSITPNIHGATAPLVAIRRAAVTANLNFAYAVVQSDFDCAGHRVAGTSMTLFGSDGRPSAVQPSSSGEDVWQPISPNTQAESAWAFVCAKSADRPSMSFRLTGLTLEKIVSSIFDGTWPYDEVLARRQSSQAKP